MLQTLHGRAKSSSATYWLRTLSRFDIVDVIEMYNDDAVFGHVWTCQRVDCATSCCSHLQRCLRINIDLIIKNSINLKTQNNMQNYKPNYDYSIAKNLTWVNRVPDICQPEPRPQLIENACNICFSSQWRTFIRSISFTWSGNWRKRGLFIAFTKYIHQIRN